MPSNKRPVRLVTGKGEFIKRVHEDGFIEDICECIWNAEFSIRGCIMQCLGGEILQEVMDNKGSYAEGNFIKYKNQGKINQKCDYCYGRWKNNGQVYPRKVNEVTFNDFKTKKPKVVRLGKITEAGHPYYYETLMDFIGLCRRFNPQPKIIFTTKALPFGLEGCLETEQEPIIRLATKFFPNQIVSGEELAERLKEVNTTLLYSIGYDCMEPGAVAQGFTNEWRIKQAERYHKKEVNTSLTIVCDITNSIEANTKAGSSIKQVIESKERTGINIRILPLRINSEKVAKKVTGKSMDLLTNSSYHNTSSLGLFENEPYSEQQGIAPYQRKGNNELVPVYFHPDFQELIDKGIGVCGAIGEYEYCDKCNFTRERIVFHRDKLPVIIYNKKSKGRINSKQRALRKHPKLDLDFNNYKSKK